jgi:hypothetical protein
MICIRDVGKKRTAMTEITVEAMKAMQVITERRAKVLLLAASPHRIVMSEYEAPHKSAAMIAWARGKGDEGSVKNKRLPNTLQNPIVK